jgi:hypothetical protein
LIKPPSSSNRAECSIITVCEPQSTNLTSELAAIIFGLSSKRHSRCRCHTVGSSTAGKRLNLSDDHSNGFAQWRRRLRRLRLSLQVNEDVPLCLAYWPGQVGDARIINIVFWGGTSTDSGATTRPMLTPWFCQSSRAIVVESAGKADV